MALLASGQLGPLHASTDGGVVLPDLLHTMVELWETLRQCGPEGLVTLQLKEPKYGPSLRQEIRDELSCQMCELCWRHA